MTALRILTIALRANNGQYVCAEGGGGREVVANRSAIGPWETFEIFGNGGNRIGLRTANGMYVCAEGGGGREVVANRSMASIWESFLLIDHGGGQVSLQAYNGMYVYAEGSGGREVVANRGAIGPWEIFEAKKGMRVTELPPVRGGGPREPGNEGQDLDHDIEVDSEIVRIVDGFPPHDAP
jgi:hypothetical protein